MLEYDRIDISEGIDVKECNETSRQCRLCKFYYFLNKNFNYQKYLCDGCHDISTKATSMQNLAIVYHGGSSDKWIVLGQPGAGLNKNNFLNQT